MNNLMRMLVLLAVLGGWSAVVASDTADADAAILLNFQRHAPADTVFYLDGLVDDETAAVAEALGAYNPQMELLVSELKNLEAEQYQAEIDFLITLLANGLESQRDGLEGLRSTYGLHESMASAVYLDGLLPEAYSLADSQGMAEVREAQGFLNYTAGFLNLLEMMRLTTDPRSNKTGEDWILLVGQDALPFMI